jgi:hypothetical protein
MPKPLSSIFLFPFFPAAWRYKEETGTDAPWDPRKRSKYWFDPGAAASARRTIVYDSALIVSDSGTIPADLNGRPMTDYLVIPKDEAVSVNIPPDGYTELVQTQWPSPFRPLTENEVLVFGSLPGMMGNQVVVADKSELEVGPDAFLKSDRTLLKATARKVGVEV